MIQGARWDGATRLRAETLPTAEELNRGTGRLAEREERWRRAARTSAYVSADFQQEYTDDLVEGWLGTPLDAEAKFARNRGDTVPDDYLARFELFLRKMHTACELALTDVYQDVTELRSDERADRVVQWSAFSDIAFLHLDIVPATLTQPCWLVLQRIYVRPCAEGFGFFRLVLHELARNCIHYGARLKVCQPVFRTQSVLCRAWGGREPDACSTETREYAPQQLGDPAVALDVERFLQPPDAPRRRPRVRARD